MLEKKLQDLIDREANLPNDPRYCLLRQMEKGADAWRIYLDQVVEDQRMVIESLQADLNDHRNEWAKMVERS